MLKRVAGWLSAAALCAAAAGVPAALAQADKAQMDKPVRDFALVNVAGDKPAVVKLSDYKNKQPVVLVWMSYNCSVTQAYEERLGKLLQQYGKEAAFVAVHANANETNERIKRYAQDKNFTGPVLDDKRKNPGLTEYFGARATPTVVVIDKKGVLRFKGRIDNNPGDVRQEDPGTKKLVANTLTALRQGKEVVVKTSPTPG